MSEKGPFWTFLDKLRKRADARAAHARGEITDEQLAEILGPPPPPGTSLGEVLAEAIKTAPPGSIGAALRDTGNELTASAIKRAADRKGNVA